MNVVEHCILEIHSVKDISDELKFPHKNRVLEVDMTFDCYGVVSRDQLLFMEPEFEEILQKGYFLN